MATQSAISPNAMSSFVSIGGYFASAAGWIFQTRWQ